MLVSLFFCFVPMSAYPQAKLINKPNVKWNNTTTTTAAVNSKNSHLKIPPHQKKDKRFEYEKNKTAT